MRGKWDDQRGDKTYGEQTIAKAIENCPYFYQGTVGVTDKVQTLLHDLYQWLMANPWHHRGGATDRHVYRALLDHAAIHGTEHPEGISVSMSARALVLEARVGNRDTVQRAIKRLSDLVEILVVGKGRRASKFLLRESAQSRAINNTVYVYGTVLRAMEKTGRVRNPSQHTSTIGKRNAQILDILFTSTHPVPLEELAQLLHVRRKRDLRRNLARLEEYGLIEYVDGGYTTPHDFEERMEELLEETGTNQVERLQRERIDREREAYRARKKHKADKVPQLKKREPVWRRDKLIPGDDFLSDCTEKDRNYTLYMFWHEEGCPCKICVTEREAERSALEREKQMRPDAGDDRELNTLLEELEQLAQPA